MACLVHSVFAGSFCDGGLGFELQGGWARTKVRELKNLSFG